MQCPRCRHENRLGAKFCEECAAPLAPVCDKCGAQLSSTAKFCSECAHPTGVTAPAAVRFAAPDSYTPKYLAERILTSKAALEGERKQVTVLFADLKGSMELLADRDPEEARKIPELVPPDEGEKHMGTIATGLLASRLVLLVVLALTLGAARETAGQPSPAGEAVMAWPITIAPTWFDPSTAPPQITPFGILYALHDALVRPLPGQKMGNSLAESWTESPDGLTYEFKLRRGLKFHNGDAVTAEDVKFSFERYKGAGAKELNLRVRQVEIIDPLTVRFVLKEPWPDFMTFYGTTATAAGIVVPKRYVMRVGDDGFRKHPIGAGPYKFVSHTPGVEVVLEADPGYWRRVPSVKRLVMKSVPEGITRVAMLKKGEADMAFLLEGPEAETVLRDARFSLVATRHASAMWIEFADQWDPKSPWHDRRVRLAVNHALDRRAISETACLGYCPAVGIIVPPVMDYALKVEPPHYDPQKAKHLLAEAGYPQGFDAGDFTPLPGFSIAGEAAVNYLSAVGIRARMRALERAAFYAAWQEKKLRGLFLTAAGNSGNAATRVEAFIYSKGSYAYGGYPDIDELFQQQARERDPAKREALLHRIQQLTIDRVMFAPIWSTRVLIGVGPRVADHTINLVPMSIWPSYEDMKLKNQ